MWSSRYRLLINNCNHQPEKNWLNGQEDSRTLSAFWLFTITENLSDMTPRLYGASDTSYTMQDSKTHTNSLPSSHREKKIFLVPSSGLTSTDRIRTHHPGAEQIAVLCFLLTVHFHLCCFRIIGWIWRYLEVMCQWEKKNPSKPLQTTLEVLEVYSVEDFVPKQMGQLFASAVLPCPPAEITIDSIEKDRKQLVFLP